MIRVLQEPLWVMIISELFTEVHIGHFSELGLCRHSQVYPRTAWASPGCGIHKHDGPPLKPSRVGKACQCNTGLVSPLEKLPMMTPFWSMAYFQGTIGVTV